MKKENTMRWLCLCTIGAALTIGFAPATHGQDKAEQPTAEELYVDGVQLFENGQLLEAKELLRRVDLAQLERAQRTDVLQRLRTIDEQLQNMPEAELRIRRAELYLKRDDLRQASEHLTRVMSMDGASASQKSEAKDMLAAVQAKQAQIKPRIPALLERSFQAYDDGNYGLAKSGLQYVFTSGVALDLDQQARLTRYLQKIYELEATRGEFNTVDIDLGALQMSDETQDDAAQPMEQEQDESSPAVREMTDDQEEANDQNQPTQEQPDEAQDESAESEDQGANGISTDLIQQARQAQIAQLMQEAQASRDAGQYREALNKYMTVLAMQPDNQDAIQGRNEMQLRLNQAEDILIQQDVEGRQLRAQSVKAEFDSLIQQAQNQVAQGKFEDALNSIARAQTTLDRNRMYLSQSEYEARRSQAANLGTQVQAQQREAMLKEAEQQQQEIAKARQEQRLQLELERQRKIAEKLVSIRRLQQAQKYDEALLELKALLFLDPGNPAAQALHDVIRDLKIYQRYEDLYTDRNRRTAEVDLDILESSRPPEDIVEYPEDWPEISLRRLGGLAYLDSQLDRQVYQALANNRVPIDFQGVPFGKAVDYIAEVAKINVDVDWASLEQNFIDRNTPVNLKLNDKVSLNVVLDRMLKKLGDDEETRPHYGINDGILTISTKEKLQQNKITHLYDIRDLLVDVPDFDNAPRFDLEAIMASNDNRGFGDQTFGAEDEVNYERGYEKRREMIDKIKTVITTNIDKLSWEVNGGDVGVIQEINGNLVITTTPQNHRQITNLLDKLREIRAIQINVESRFLLVSEDFFEQIGFDLDLYWGGDPYRRDKLLDPNLLPSDLFTDPRDGSTGNPRAQRQYISLFDLVGQTDANGNPQFDANGRQVIQEVLPDAGIFQAGRNQWTPQAILNDTLNMANNLFGADGTSFAGQALSATPAFQYAVTYLDNIQVDLLIRATQADRRSIQLTAPKLTFFNGQRSFVQVTTSQFFISDLQPVVGTSSAGFDPQLSPLREGVVLDVEGTVSADRRYVTMTVLTSLAKILDINTTSVPIVVGGQVIQSDDAAILSQTAAIERPEIQISRVNTTVTVPDKGTILLGGQSIRNDIEVETGVPVLSKIPVINRFFTNRIMSTEERTLYILMRPTVIIQQENEDRLFPGLQDTIRGTGGLGGQY